MLTAVPDIPGLRPLLGPDAGEEDEEAPDHTDVDLIGIFVGIEYRDGEGSVSRRRVSVCRASATHMDCYCHERQAPRSFRIAGILAFIDLDGVVHTPADFFAVLAGGDAAVLRRPAGMPGDCLRRPWRREIAVLAALGTSDGFMHPAEVEEIIQFVGLSAEIEGIAYADADLAALAETVRRLKISEAEAVEHIETIARDRKHPRRRDRLRRAIARVATADGVLHPAEFRFAQMAERRLSD